MILVFRFCLLGLFGLAIAYGCTGDCASCHTQLDYKQDPRHAPMLECKSCHTEEKMASIPMGDICGSDCFACHNAQKLQTQKLAPDHQIINTCISCHKNLAKDTFNKSIMHEGFIRDFFNHPKDPKNINTK